jgi:hypothetical protein
MIHVAFLKLGAYHLQDEDHFIIEPSHWMPLPTPPSGDADRGGISHISSPTVPSRLRNRSRAQLLNPPGGGIRRAEIPPNHADAGRSGPKNGRTHGISRSYPPPLL